jgi:hypothetical protein
MSMFAIPPVHYDEYQDEHHRQYLTMHGVPRMIAVL